MLPDQVSTALHQVRRGCGEPSHGAFARAFVFTGLLAAGLLIGDGTKAVSQPAEVPPASGAPAAVPPTAPDTPAAVTPPPGSDWPCVQRKVETLSSAQIWDGPPVDDIKNWSDDKDIANLARFAVSRRIEMDQVEAEIEKFAKSLPEAERDQKLTLLFAGVLHETNLVRSRVVNNIETFQRRQRARSQHLEEQGKELANLHSRAAKGEQVSDQINKLQTEYDWNARVFAERQANLPLACEIPVLIEQRAFAVGRAIRSHMSE